MLPEIDVFGIELKTFGIFFALNFLAWGAVAAQRFRELGRPEDLAYEMVFAALGGGIVGAKLYWAIDNGELDGVRAVQRVGADVVRRPARRRDHRHRVGEVARRSSRCELLDIAGIGLPLGYAIGRIGCQISGDGDYGEPSDLPWAMGYPDGVVPTDPGVEVHPTPLYEAITMGLLAWALWRAARRRAARRASSRSTSSSPGSSASWSSSCAATRRRSRGLTTAQLHLAGDGRGRGRVARRRCSAAAGSRAPATAPRSATA